MSQRPAYPGAWPQQMPQQHLMQQQQFAPQQKMPLYPNVHGGRPASPAAPYAYPQQFQPQFQTFHSAPAQTMQHQQLYPTNASAPHAHFAAESQSPPPLPQRRHQPLQLHAYQQPQQKQNFQQIYAHQQRPTPPQSSPSSSASSPAARPAPQPVSEDALVAQTSNLSVSEKEMRPPPPNSGSDHVEKIARLCAELDAARRSTVALTERSARDAAESASRIASLEADLERRDAAVSELRTKTATLETLLRNKEAEMNRLLAAPKAEIEEKDRIIAELTRRIGENASAAKAEMDSLSRLLDQEKKSKESALQQISQMPPDPFANWTRNLFDAAEQPKAAPPPLKHGADPDLWERFYKADLFHTHRLDGGQLSIVLSQGPWPPLSMRSVILLIRAYDRNGDFVNFEFFSKMWPTLHTWKSVFLRNHNAGPNAGEFVFGYLAIANLRDSLKECGIVVPSRVMELMLKRMRYPGGLLGWDDFVGVAAKFHSQINEFERIDTDHDRAITIFYDQYMDAVNRFAT